MANGTRENGITNTPTDLTFQFYKNIDGVNTKFSAQYIDKVEIYSDLGHANANANVIETIEGTGEIIESGTGLYSYTAAALSAIGTYWDKIYIKPAVGDSIISFTNPFYIRKEEYWGSPDLKRTRIYLNLYDIIENAQTGDKVTFKLNKKIVWSGDDIIQQESEDFYARSDGLVCHYEGDTVVPGIDILNTSDLRADETGEDVYYEVNVSNKFFTKVEVPRGGQMLFKDLPVVT